MSSSDNHLKTKSGRRLRREIQDSKQRIVKAGSNDVSNQPGSLLRVHEVIFQPQTISTGVWFGEAFTTRSGGDARGGVGMPPLSPRAALHSDDAVFPYAYSQRWRQLNIRASDVQSDIDRPNVTNNAGANLIPPTGVTRSGSLVKELDRTSGPDNNRRKRTEARQRRHSRDRVL